LSHWPAIWAIFAGGLVAGAYMTKVAPALPGLRGELGLTLVQSGFIATTFNLMGMLVGMLAGVLCDRFGHKRLAVAGLLILFLGGALGAAATGCGGAGGAPNSSPRTLPRVRASGSCKASLRWRVEATPLCAATTSVGARGLSNNAKPTTTARTPNSRSLRDRMRRF